MRTLVPGERVGVAGEVALSVDVALRPPLALAMIALDRERRIVPGFAPLDSIRREMRPAARFDGDTLRIALGDMPGSVERLAVAAFLTGGAGGGVTFRDLAQIELRTGDLRFPLHLADRADTAIVLAELYRHAGGWRLAANGQGFVHGLPALADAFGGDRGWAARLIERPAPGAGAAPERGRPGEGASSSGSGVAIDRYHILTNAHVVEGAREVSAAGEGRTLGTEIVFADPRNDLALLRVSEALPAIAPFRDALELHLGEEVVALGYPLQGLLGTGPQASAGNIAALSGIGNDTGLFQFTAPIASGNSGGPILDASGLIVGLVSSSLNLDRVRAGGGSAENVNFGIKGAIVRSFLDAFGATPTLARSDAAIGRAAMVRAARASLYRIGCRC